MSENKLKVKIIEKRSNKAIFISAFALAIISLVFVVSAEMGETSSNTSYLLESFIKSLVYLVAAIVWYFLMSRIDTRNLPLTLFYIAYAVILFLLLACRAFGSIGGAYAWIRLGPASLQPSEFAKHMVILLGAKLFSKDYGLENKKMFWIYAALSWIYALVIMFYQHDLGSAVVLLILWFCISLLNPHRDLRDILAIFFIVLLVGIGLIILALSPIGNAFFESHADNYMSGRFLASSNPFDYAYDYGYHVVMSLITFASGGFFGVGLGNSIHKHMNFPNPSTDFILPVIVEEGGIFMFLIIVGLYLCIIIPIMHKSNKTHDDYSRIVYAGFLFYFIAHFILNVGGVTGLIPLTGVPLLLLSGGGSSLMACFGIIGSCQLEIIRGKKN